MRPSSSKERATGETTLGSLAASSTLKPSRTTNVLAACDGSTAGNRGISFGLISGSAARTRSEEHTSELQSQSNLVCRLLLEKKKNTLSTHVYAMLHLTRRTS